MEVLMMNVITQFKHQDDNIKISLIDMSMAAEVFDLVQANEAILRPWFPWVNSMKTMEDETAFIEYAQIRYQQQKEMVCTIMVNERIVGMIDLHNINLSTRTAEIGYWLSENFQHRGLMQACVDEFCNYSFHRLGLNEIKLLSRPNNQASRNVAKRCHFVLKAEIPVVRKIGDYDHDFVIYSRKSDLKADYR